VKLDPLIAMADRIHWMATLDVPFMPFAFPERGSINVRQFDYMVAQFKKCIKSFVAGNQNPFIHPLLYQETIPEAYQDVLGVCSLVCKSCHRYAYF